MAEIFDWLCVKSVRVLVRVKSCILCLCLCQWVSFPIGIHFFFGFVSPRYKSSNYIVNYSCSYCTHFHCSLTCRSVYSSLNSTVQCIIISVLFFFWCVFISLCLLKTANVLVSTPRFSRPDSENIIIETAYSRSILNVPLNCRLK